MKTEGRDLRDAGDADGRASISGREMSPSGINFEGMRRVALEEMAVRRRRLGELTPAQERALESLLVSVADNISDLISGVAAGPPRDGPGDEACAQAVNRVGMLCPARS